MFSWQGKKKGVPAVEEDPRQPTVCEVLLSARPSNTFAAWADEGRLGQVMPELDALRAVSQLPAHRDNAFIHTMKVVDAIEPTLVRRWAGLLHDIAKAPTYLETPDGRSHFFEHDRIGAEMAGEIMLAHDEEPPTIEAVQRLVCLHMRPPSYREEWTDAAVRRLVEEAEEGRGREGWDDLIALSRADLHGYLPEPIDRGLWVLQSLDERRRRLDREARQEELDEEQGPRSPLDGTELLALGSREPGPWVGELKTFLTGEVRSGRLHRDDKALAAELARWWLDDGSNE